MPTSGIKSTCSSTNLSIFPVETQFVYLQKYFLYKIHSQSSIQIRALALFSLPFSMLERNFSQFRQENLISEWISTDTWKRSKPATVSNWRQMNEMLCIDDNETWCEISHQTTLVDSARSLSSPWSNKITALEPVSCSHNSMKSTHCMKNDSPFSSTSCLESFLSHYKIVCFIS